MAREVGLEKLYLQCYYEPTLQAHTTVSSLIARMKVSEDGQVSFDEGAQRKEADKVLIAAHNVMLYILKAENDHFNMGLQDEIEKRFAEFMFIWGKEKPA